MHVDCSVSILFDSSWRKHDVKFLRPISIAAFWCQNLSTDEFSPSNTEKEEKTTGEWILETIKDGWLMWLKKTWEDSAIGSAKREKSDELHNLGTVLRDFNEPTIKQLGESKDAEWLIGVFATTYGLGCIVVHNHRSVQITRTPNPSKWRCETPNPSKWRCENFLSDEKRMYG